MTPPRAFITGGTGFVGANLVAGLNQEGIPARVLRRNSSSLKALDGLSYESAFGDVLSEPAVLAEAMAGCDWLFHVAAVSDYWRQSRDLLYRVNVDGTRNVLNAARAAGVRRVVFTSSLAALGLPAPGRLLDESSQFNLRPEQFPYGHSKHLAEIEVARAVETGLEVVIINPTIVLGPRDVNQNSGSLIVEAARGLLRFAPPGGANFVAVEDVVAGHIAAARLGRVGERYILAGENLTHRQATAIVCRQVGRRPPFLSLPRWSLPPLAAGVTVARRFFGNRIPMDAIQVHLSGAFFFADGRKAICELGLPHTPFAAAVQRTYEWYNSNGYFK